MDQHTSIGIGGRRSKGLGWKAEHADNLLKMLLKQGADRYKKNADPFTSLLRPGKAPDQGPRVSGESLSLSKEVQKKQLNLVPWGWRLAQS